MTDTRRVVAVDGEGEITILTESIPSPGDGEIQVDVRASAITPGSGAQPVANRRANPDPNRGVAKRGYQAAGVVRQTGPDVEALSVGDRVACMGSGYAYHADAVVVPQQLCVPLPPSVSFAEGAFNHLAATGLHAIRRAEVQIGEFVVVIGLGLVGQCTCQLAQIAGGRAIGIDRLAGRVGLAADTGIECTIEPDADPLTVIDELTEGRGIDCGVIAFGGDASEAFHQLTEMTKMAPDGHRYGRIVIVGGAHIAADFPTPQGNMDIRPSSRPGPGYHDADWERGQPYPDAYRGDIEWTTHRNLAECMRLIDQGDLDIGTLITDRFALADAAAAYDAILEHPNETLGVVLEP